MSTSYTSSQIDQETFDPDYQASRVVAINGMFWQKIEVAYDDLWDEGALKTVNLYSLPAGACIHAVKIKHSEAFAGGAIAAYTLEVGIETDTDKYHSALSVTTEVSATNYSLAPVSGDIAGESHDAATWLTLTARSTGDTLDHATAGVANIWLLISRAD